MKILFVTTISNTVNAFLIPHIKMLVKQGHQVDVAYNPVQEADERLTQIGCNIYTVEFQRSPLNFKNIGAFKKIKALITSNKYDVVHTHTPIASTIVRLACKGIDDAKVIYTAHGFHFFKGSSLQSWLIYFTLEKYLSRYTDLIITINSEDFSVTKEKFHAKKIQHVAGVGLDISKIKEVKLNKEEKRSSLNIPSNSILLLSIGELNENKNHAVIIQSLAKINNPRLVYAICGVGPKEQYLIELSEKLNVKDQIKFLGYRTDIAEILKITDIFVFPSFREGLPVSIMEAMAAELPVVCSDIRGNRDLIDQGKGGYRIESNNIEGYVSALAALIENVHDRNEFGKWNSNAVNKYSIEKVILEMDGIYSEFSRSVYGRT